MSIQVVDVFVLNIAQNVAIAHSTLTWRGCARRLQPGARLLVAEVHRLRFRPIKSSLWRTICVLYPDATRARLWVLEASARRPVWYEWFHTERQIWTFGFTPSNRWQVQLISSNSISGSILRRSLPGSGHGRWSLRRIHYARLRCHTTNFPAALSDTVYVFVASLEEISASVDVPPMTLQLCVFQAFTHRLVSPLAQCHKFPFHLAACLSVFRCFHVTGLKRFLIGRICKDSVAVHFICCGFWQI